MSSMKEKIKLTEPYNLFYTTNTKICPSSNQINLISFSDLFCPSLGQLKSIFFASGLVERNWLLQEFKDAQQTQIPITLVYSSEKENEIHQTKNISTENFKSITIHHLNTLSRCLMELKKYEHMIHRIKLGIFVYEDNSLRVVIFTADLTYDEWNCCTQGVWISPVCSVLLKDEDDKEGESATKFKSQLVACLEAFKLDKIGQWLNYVKRADFKSVRVVLLTQTVGNHYSRSEPPTCLKFALHKLLRQHCKLENDSWDIVIQVSSIGHLGESNDEWFLKELIDTLAMSQEGSKYKNIRIVYPTQKEVESTSFKLEVGEKLSFWMDPSISSQRWVLEYLNCWKINQNDKWKLLPQMKSYCRISECQTKLAWFMMTTANMSKSAWGSYKYDRRNFWTRRTEIGILFLPNFFNEEHFKLKNFVLTKNRDSNNFFPVIFDVPLQLYGKSDKPWVSQKVNCENALYQITSIKF